VAAPRKHDAPKPQQLPSGRHGLPPQFVASNQRERIIVAVAEVCSTAGYAAMSVEDIVVASGVSRRTFYDNFQDKEDAFLAAYDEVASRLLLRVKTAYETNEGIVPRAREGLSALLGFLAAEPAFADMCVVEALAAGPMVVARRNANLRTLSDLIDQTAAAAMPADATPPSPIIAQALVGGIFEVVYSRVLAGRHDELPGLLPGLIFTLLLPYAGHDVATQVLKKERRRMARTGRAAGSHTAPAA
jgi:AcrR family transcriptional regulator